MTDYQKKAEALIGCLGGPDNITTLTNCMTRVRATVRSEASVNESDLRALNDVMGIVHDRDNTYEIVVGPGKSTKYVDACHSLGLSAGSAAEPAGPETGSDPGKRQPVRKHRRIKSAFKLLGDIFVPLIPGVITAGLCAGFAALIAQLVPDYESSKFWNILYNLFSLVNISFMTYLTAWAGYRAAERFGATPILGGMLGMMTTLEGIAKISRVLGLYDEQNPLNSILREGKGGILAVVAGVFLLSVIEKRLRSWIPDSIGVIFTPLLSLLICAVPYVLLLMPLFGFVSSGLVWVVSRMCLSGSVIVRLIAGYLSAALFLPLVAGGMHHGMVALYSVQLQEFGYITLYPALAMAGAGQVGAALALWIKARKVGNSKLDSIISGALPAGFLGIGEPLIYGVTLPLGKPFITAGLGAGFGGALVMAMEVASTTWGPSGILGVFVMTGGPRGATAGVLFYLAGLAVSYVCSFILTGAFCSEDLLRPEPPADPDVSEASPVPEAGLPGAYRTVRHGDPLSLGDLTLAAPADGKLIPMKEIPDAVFASGTLGVCAGILPENGKIYAPCDGVVSVVTETKHAVTFSTPKGKNILLHAGIDTVKLGGKGFTVLVRKGDPVKKGDPVLEADLDVIRQAGFSPVVITASCP